MSLPRPEHAINKRMMEEENRIKRCRVILSHIPISAHDRARIMRWNLDTPDGEVDLVV